MIVLVKCGVFVFVDIWIFIDYLFWCDDDGDYWLVGGCGLVVCIVCGMVYIELVINVLGFIIGVDFVVIYGVLVCGCYVVVLVVMLLFGVIIIVVDLIEVVVSMLVGLGFDIVYVVL